MTTMGLPIATCLYRPPSPANDNRDRRLSRAGMFFFSFYSFFKSTDNYNLLIDCHHHQHRSTLRWRPHTKWRRRPLRRTTTTTRPTTTRTAAAAPETSPPPLQHVNQNGSSKQGLETRAAAAIWFFFSHFIFLLMKILDNIGLLTTWTTTRRWWWWGKRVARDAIRLEPRCVFFILLITIIYK